MSELAFGLVGLGVVFITIGGFITMIRNPKLHNDQARAYIDPVRTNIPKGAKTALDRATWSDPHARWFSGVGIALFLLGIGVLTTREPSETRDASPVKIGTELHE